MSVFTSEFDSASDYAAWLIQAKCSLSQQYHITSFTFSADGSAVSFDNISYATCKVLSEHQPEQE